MAKQLTPDEEKSMADLGKDMQQRLSVFEKECQDKTKDELDQELKDLDEYLKGCRNSEIDDTLTNIRFCEGKISILKRLLGQSTT